MKAQSLLVLIAILMSTSSWAGKESGGGNVRLISPAEVRLYIENKLRSRFLAFSEQYKPTFIGEAATAFQKFVRQGLLKDIELSPYRVSESCVEEGGNETSSSTLIGVRNAEICFNVNKLARENVTVAQLFGLVMHEHLHHFGLLDGQYSLAVLSQDVEEAVQGRDEKIKLVDDQLNAAMNYLTPLSSNGLSDLNVCAYLGFISGNFRAVIRVAYAHAPQLGKKAVARVLDVEKSADDLDSMAGCFGETPSVHSKSERKRIGNQIMNVLRPKTMELRKELQELIK